MRGLVASPDAYRLLHDGAVTLAKVEAAGVRIDVDYLDRAIAETTDKIAALEKQLRGDEVWRHWRRRHGDKANLDSLPQLTEVLFGAMKVPYPGGESRTATGRYRADEEVLSKVDLPFVKDYLGLGDLKKVKNTYLLGIRRETVNGYLHPSFNLNTAVTFRSCVAKGTLVEVVRDVSKFPRGIPIEDIRVGDYVYCYDDDLNLTIRRVLWAGKTGHRKVVRLHWSARGKKGWVDVTPEHKIRLSDGRYVRADRLEGRDLRRVGESRHSPRIRALAMGRVDDRLYQTGKIDAVLDHRLVYQNLVGPLKDSDVVHHKDNNHLNNQPTNLEKHTPSSHAKHHAPTSLTDDGRRKGVRNRVENHKKYGDRWLSGEDNPSWIKLSKFSLLRMLARCGGKWSKLPLDFDVMKRKARLLGVNLKAVKRRYDRNGYYIGRGRLGRILRQGRTFAKNELGINFYKLKELMIDYGFPITRTWANQFGEFVPNNHAIVRVEHLPDMVDVYDIEVEGSHNFIAGEICVHNSSSDPNFQNLPTRDPVRGELVRRAFIPRDPNNHIVEADFKGIEVAVAACYNHDPVLIRYIKDPTTDMHRDTAMQLFGLEKAQVDKKTTRDWAKNRFVFPQFYGSVYFQCAPHLWEAASDPKHKLPGGGVSVYKHLKRQGIRELGACQAGVEPGRGTFEYRVKEVETDFWQNRFKVYTEWKKRWWEAYLKAGEFLTLTGFRIGPVGKKGLLARNDALNYPIQGSAFHCLLWTLIRLQRWLEKYKMKTKIVGQIHDSIIADVPSDELQDYLDAVTELISVKLPQTWKWIIVPMTAEVEVCPMGQSWFFKKGYIKGDNGLWSVAA